MQDEFQMAESDDFPALPSAGVGSNKTDFSSSQSVLSGLLGRELGAVGEKGRVGSSALNTPSDQPSTTNNSGLLVNLNTAAGTGSVNSVTPLSKEMKFGLAGLLEIIRGTDKVRWCSLLTCCYCFLFSFYGLLLTPHI
jgi:hypothetical protein